VVLAVMRLYPAGLVGLARVAAACGSRTANGSAAGRRRAGGGPAHDE